MVVPSMPTREAKWCVGGRKVRGSVCATRAGPESMRRLGFWGVFVASKTRTGLEFKRRRRRFIGPDKESFAKWERSNWELPGGVLRYCSISRWLEGGGVAKANLGREPCVRGVLVSGVLKPAAAFSLSRLRNLTTITTSEVCCFPSAATVINNSMTYLRGEWLGDTKASSPDLGRGGVFGFALVIGSRLDSLVRTWISSRRRYRKRALRCCNADAASYSSPDEHSGCRWDLLKKEIESIVSISMMYQLMPVHPTARQSRFNLQSLSNSCTCDDSVCSFSPAPSLTTCRHQKRDYGSFFKSHKFTLRNWLSFKGNTCLTEQKRYTWSFFVMVPSAKMLIHWVIFRCRLNRIR